MARFKYLMRVDPYEVKGLLGTSQIKTVREEILEFDLALLAPGELDVFMAAQSFGAAQIRHYEVKSGIVVSNDEAVSDHVLELDEAIALLAESQQDKLALEAEAKATRELAAAERAQVFERARIDREAKAAAARDARIAAIEAAKCIEWNAEGRAILNLYERIALVAGIEFDSRFANWIKRVTSVNAAPNNGYMFEGDWVKDETIELGNADALYLVAGKHGSRKNQTTEYRVVILRNGRLETTDIAANNEDRGWALLIRDRIAALLAELGT